MHKVTMLGTGLIGMFYTKTLHRNRSLDQVAVVYSRTEERAKHFASEWNIPKYTTNLEDAINDPDTDVVVIGLPNNLHEEAVRLATQAGKHVFRIDWVDLGISPTHHFHGAYVFAYEISDNLNTVASQVNNRAPA